METHTEHKKNIKFCFIILHYGPINLTKKTIKSIIDLPEAEKVIIVVDNGTHIASEALKEDPVFSDVNVVELEKNMGFSKGNNLGYSFAKTLYEFDFLIVANNDVLFNDTRFLSKMVQSYIETPFHVAGPDIYIPNEKKHSNPLRQTMLSSDDMNRLIKSFEHAIEQYQKRISLYAFINYIKRKKSILYYLYFAYRKIIKLVQGSAKQPCVNDIPQKKQNNIVLQGSCYIFDKQYCLSHTKLFEPEVFLYCEEDFLAYKCYSEGLTTLYLPEIHVIHSHMGSSSLNKASYRKFCDAKAQMYKQRIISVQQYIDYINPEKK